MKVVPPTDVAAAVGSGHDVGPEALPLAAPTGGAQELVDAAAPQRRRHQGGHEAGGGGVGPGLGRRGRRKHQGVTLRRGCDNYRDGGPRGAAAAVKCALTAYRRIFHPMKDPYGVPFLRLSWASPLLAGGELGPLLGGTKPLGPPSLGAGEPALARRPVPAFGFPAEATTLALDGIGDEHGQFRRADDEVRSHPFPERDGRSREPHVGAGVAQLTIEAGGVPRSDQFAPDQAEAFPQVRR